jgi:SAM-dependent methyltransferase
VGSLKDKTMLEIGGGEGLFSLWGLAHGLKSVTILEPEMDGSRPGVGKRLEERIRLLNLSVPDLEFLPVTFQDYSEKVKSFDIMLSYSSINHLNEAACAQLKRSKDARAKYLEIFRKSYDFLKPGGHFVISDAGRLNFWGFLGTKSPFAPTLEWKKHQEPIVWKNLLREAGFEFLTLEWHRFYPLRRLGVLCANRLFAMATTSQFILTVRKSRDQGNSGSR